MTESELSTIEKETAMGFLREAVNARIAYAKDRPWMPMPNPLLISISDLQMLISEIDRLTAEVAAKHA